MILVLVIFKIHFHAFSAILVCLQVAARIISATNSLHLKEKPKHVNQEHELGIVYNGQTNQYLVEAICNLWKQPTLLLITKEKSRKPNFHLACGSVQPKPSTGLETGVYAVTLNALCNLIYLALFSLERQWIRQKLGVSSNKQSHRTYRNSL